MVKVIFAKVDNSWYLLSADASKEERMMILGADTLLDLATESTHSCYQTFFAQGTSSSDKYMLQSGKNGGYSALYRRQIIPSGGAAYVCPSYKGKNINQYLWLCEPMGKVLGGFPEVILFKKQ